MSRAVRFAPFALLLVLIAGLVWRLAMPADTNVTSKLEGKPVPAFDLGPGVPTKAALSSRDLADGRPKLVNIFASWCVPCIAEAPLLLDLESRGVPIDAVAIRDRPQDIARFLARWGDPYRNIGLDADSRVQLSIGSSGVPETFVIDGEGIIRHQHIGAITEADVADILEAYEAAR